MLGDVQRSGDHGVRPLKKGRDGHHRAAGIQKEGGTGWNRLRDLFPQALLGFRQQRVAALTIHGGKIKGDSATVVLLGQPLIFQVGEIPTDGIC